MRYDAHCDDLKVMIHDDLVFFGLTGQWPTTRIRKGHFPQCIFEVLSPSISDSGDSAEYSAAKKAAALFLHPVAPRSKIYAPAVLKM